MGHVIALKHVRLTRTFQAVEAAVLSLDSELRGLRAVCAAGMPDFPPDFPEETTLLRTYVRTLSVLLQAMTPDEIDEAGLSDRYAVAEATVGRCAATLRALAMPTRPEAVSGTA